MKNSGEVESLWREVVAGRCLEAAVGPGTAGRSRHRRGFSFSLVVRQERASTAHACKGSSRGDFRRGCKSVGSMRSRPRFDHAERAAGARDHILWAVSTRSEYLPQCLSSQGLCLAEEEQLAGRPAEAPTTSRVAIASR